MTEFKTEIVKVDNTDMIKLTINGQEFVVDLETAGRMGAGLTAKATLPGQLAYINRVFDDFGDSSDSW